MELLILPFCIPLLLVGRIVEFVAERRREQERRPEPVPAESWMKTWFALQGPPSGSGEVASESPSDA